MRRFTCLGSLAALILAAIAPGANPAAAAPDLRSDKVLLRSHFLGGTAIKSRPEATRWSAMTATNTAFADLCAQTTRKLATTPFRALRPGLAAGATDHAEALKPLFDDLLLAESWIEWRGTAKATEQLGLAIRLSDARAKEWSATLSAIVKEWSGQAPQTETAGWQARFRGTPNMIGFARVDDWVVVGVGQDSLKLWTEFQSRLKSKTQPFAADSKVWLDLWADWPQVQPRLPLPLPVNAPEAHLTLVGEGQSLRWRGTFAPEQPLNWKPEAWQTPTNFIREPLIGFTAMRGVSSVLGENYFLRGLGLSSLPSQLYLWAKDGSPFQVYAAAPAPGAASSVRKAAAGITNKWNPDLDRLHIGALGMATTNNILTWSGLPLVTPHFGAVKSGGKEFLVAGLFPLFPRGDLPPKELLQQFEPRTDLAYYDWEVTEPRLGYWRTLGQLFQMVGRQPQFNPNQPAIRWLTSIEKGLGDTVTEIAVAGPRELRLNRKSAMGFTAGELVYLAYWLESSDFPYSPIVKPGLPAPGKRPPGSPKPAAAPNAAPGR